MTFAVNLDVIRMDHVQDGSDHLGSSVSTDVLVRGTGMEIKVDAKGQNVRIIAKAVDWSQWDEVDVYLKYDDDKNNVHFEEDLIVLDSKKDSHTTSIPIMDKSIRPTIQVTYVNYNGNMATSDTVSVPESGLIVLPASAPPKAE